MPYRKVPLVEGEIYHIFTKSIAGFRIFNSNKDFQRAIETLFFYTLEKPPCKFSLFSKEPISKPLPCPTLPTGRRQAGALELGKKERIVRILGYCIMPTHIHLITQQLKDNGISQFINLALKSYSKYFNERFKRKGPLWEGRFKNVLVETQEHLLHLTRYIHLNPVTAFLVNNPKEWEFSSYKEYIGLCDENKKLCQFSSYLDIDASNYEEFVKDNIDYQRSLSKIKHLVIE